MFVDDLPSSRFRSSRSIVGLGFGIRQRSPSDGEGRSHYNESVQKIAPHRDDLITWFDLLDLDDYASFGGQV